MNVIELTLEEYNAITESRELLNENILDIFKKNKIKSGKENKSRYLKFDYKDKERTIMFSDSFKTDINKRNSVLDDVVKEVKKAIDNEKKLLNIIYSSKELSDMSKEDKDENYLDWFEIYDSDNEKDKFNMAVYTKYGQMVLDKVKSGNGNVKNVRYND